jgi:hypothetical protein
MMNHDEKLAGAKLEKFAHNNLGFMKASGLPMMGVP